MTEKRYESDLTPKEKRQKEWEKIKSMSWKDRFSHIWAYYKPHMVITLALLMLLGLIGQMIYRAQFDTVFSAAVINAVMGDSDLMEADFKEYLGDEDKYHEIMLDSSMYLTGDVQADYNTTMKLSTMIGAHEIEVMIAPKSEFEKYKEMEAYMPLKELLTKEQIEAYGDDLSEYGLHVGGSSKLEEFGMAAGDDAYLAVFMYAKNIDNVKSFITYIYEGGK